MKLVRCSISFCSLGIAGLIVDYSKKNVNYSDGTNGLAYTGFVVHDSLVKSLHSKEEKLISAKKGDLWYSTKPVFITEVYIDIEKSKEEQIEDAHNALILQCS